MRRCFLTVCLIVLGILSCTREAVVVGPAQVKFTFQANIRDGRISEAAQPVAVLLSIHNSSGESVFEDKKLPLYAFGNSFTSEPVSLVPGDYALVKFWILDEANQVVFAAPCEGSEAAHLVDDPLPLLFSVSDESVAEVTPEVLAVGQIESDDFGYYSLGFEVRDIVLQEIKDGGYTYRYHYDDRKLLKSISVVLPSGEEVETNSYEYKDEVLVKEREYLLSGQFYYEKVFFYKEGKLEKVNTFFDTGVDKALPYVSNYLYSGNQVVTIEEYTPDLKLLTKVNIHYDKADNIVKIFLFGFYDSKTSSIKETVQSTHKEEYFYDNMLVPSQQMPHKPYLASFSFKELTMKHNVTRAIHQFAYASSSPQTTYDMVIKYQYNELGYPVHEIVSDGMSESIREFTFGN